MLRSAQAWVFSWRMWLFREARDGVTKLNRGLGPPRKNEVWILGESVELSINVVDKSVV